MEIKRNGTRPSGKGPVDWFTGTVRIDPLFDAPEPARAAGARWYATSDACARYSAFARLNKGSCG